MSSTASQAKSHGAFHVVLFVPRTGRRLVLMRVCGRVQGDDAPDSYEIGRGRARGSHEPRARRRAHQGRRAGLVGPAVPDSGPASTRSGVLANVRRRDGDLVRLGLR